jgi:hypothetical protein
MNTNPAGVLSPKTLARLIGVLTLLTIAGGIYALLFVGDRLIAWRDPAATAANILAHKNLYLSAVAVFLVEMALSVTTTALSYLLLRPAGPTIALVTLCLGMVANAIKTGARVLFAAPVYLLGSERFPSLGPAALNDLSLLLLLVGDHAAGIAMAFIGFHFVLDGWLILRSTFLPKFLGVLTIAGGLAWLTHLWPPLGYRVGMVGMLVGLVAVVAQVTWYLAVGVNEERWHAQARGGAGA